jgi:hypothetical protein
MVEFVMLNNDLSNKAAPVLAFNFERIICEKFEKKRFKYHYSVNKQHVYAINQLYWKEFSIYYVTFIYPGKKLDALEQELDELGCMYNGTIRTNDIDSLLYWFRQQSAGWYYDTDKNIVEALHPFGQQWNDAIISIWNKG